MNLRRSTAPLTGDRLFAWALGAPYHVMHGVAVDGPEGLTGKAATDTRAMLSRDWDVSGRDDLVTRLTRLGNEGHRRVHREQVNRYATMWRPEVAARREECLGIIREDGENAGAAAGDLWLLDAVQADRRGVRGSPLLAFDVARGIMLARDGLALGWLREDEAFDYMTDAAAEARRTYRSWAEYGADYLLSRDVWAGEERADGYDHAVATLLRDRASPWASIPWEGVRLPVPRPIRPIAPDAPVWTLERG